MRKRQILFVVSILCLTASIVIALTSTWELFFKTHIPMCFLASYSLILCGLGIFSHFLTSKLNRDNPAKYINVFMALKMVKLLGSLAFILVYFVKIDEDTKIFVAGFVLIYLIYLALDTVFYLSEEKNHNTTPKDC